MLKYIAIALLLLPLPSPQPRVNKGNSNQPANAPQLAAATPLNSPNAQTENPGPQTPGSQSEEAKRQAEIAKAAQATSDRIATATIIIAVFGALSFLATCGYIVAAFLQWGRVREQAKKAGEQVIKMQAQLAAMIKQEGHMSVQAMAAKDAADAMTAQVKVTEGALKATRESVDVAWEGLKTQKRAYLGTNRMNIDLREKKRLAIYLTNTGKLPALNVKAKLQVTISTPVDWHETQPENVRIFALGEEDYNFTLSAIYPDSIPVQIGFPLGRHFSDEELTLVVQKKSRLTVNLSLEYQDGFDDGFSYFVLTYRGKDTHGNDSWGIFPTESEKQYDQTNPN